MYLKKIEMQGFKSFADKTIITFEDSITAIVGPNGSGKSNVSDAIKWVLGEQSAKSLRGGRMEDVIFAGTDKRKQLGYSEVSITFDNKERLIPIEFSEVEITRRMFRSGESEFYINKSPCRLRDIKELIMDTGIGKDGYSIIGQGRIEEILSDKPEDRRGIFEEAAGIVKFKTLKDESERKLEKTQVNLIRINDLFGEIEKQNKNLEKDSVKAVDYLNIYNELKTSQITLFLNDINLHKSQLLKLEEEAVAKNNKLEKMNEDKAIMEENLNKIKQELVELNINIDYKRELTNEYTRKLDELKRKIDISNERKKYEELEVKRLETEINGLESEIFVVETSIRERNKELEDLEKSLVSFNDLYESKDNELENLSKKIKIEEEKLEDIKAINSELFNMKIEVNSKISNIESNISNLNDRMKIISKDLNSMIIEDVSLEEKLKELIEKNEDLVTRLDKSESEKNEYEGFIKDKESEIAKEKDELSDLKVSLQNNISNYNIYKNMEEAYEGYYKSVKNLLLAVDTNKVSQDGFNGVVADLLKVKSTYELAIETTLGSNLQNIVVERDTDAKKYIDYLHKNKAGRVTFLPLNKIKGNVLNISNLDKKEYGILGLAKEFIDYDIKYEDLVNHLLGRTIIVDNLDNGIKLSRKYNYRIVTLGGDILNPGGSITGGSYGKNTLSIISRKNKVLKLKDSIKEIQLTYNSKLAKLESNIESTKELEIRYKQLLVQTKEINDEKTLIVESLNKENIFKENLSLQINRLKHEFEGLENNKNILEKEKDDLMSSLTSHEKEGEEHSKNIDIKSKVFVELKNEYEEKLNNFTSLKIEYNNSKNIIDNLKGNINSLEITLNSFRDNLNKSKIQKEETLSKIETMDKEIIENQKEVQKATDLLNEHNEDFEKELAKSQEMRESRESIDKDLRLLTEEIYIDDRLSDEIKLNISKEQMQINNIEKDLFINYELDYEAAERYKLLDADIVDLRIIVEDLNKKIKKLGNVNIDSIEEYKEVNERYNFLLDQKTDLESSRDNLLKVIKDIEKEMEEKFRVSIQEIDKNFQKIFKVLFNGGSAGLKIEDEEDILSSGIEIIAQPPGKKLQNIRLLSGGEKSLTAVALLFAILEIKPSPFCILDEIDAALDDANIGRYTGYLSDLKDETQFILITHRKTTMEIADILYGVTMEEEGVSKLYSLKMEDYMD